MKESKQKFDEALGAVLKVSHAELKDMLEVEKAEKKKKQKRKSKTSASDRASGAGKG